MNTRISDAAIERWAEQHGLSSRSLRAAYEEAAQPAKPEAVRLRDELRERAAFEAWATQERYEIARHEHFPAGYVNKYTREAWCAWKAALSSVQTAPAVEAYHPAQRMADIEGRIEPSMREMEGMDDPSPEMDAGLHQWLKERDLLPAADEDGGIDMDAVIQALNEHELMLGGVPQPSPAGQGDARSLAEHITDHLCENEYDIGGRSALLDCVAEAIGSYDREKFEVWAGINGYPLTRADDGEYCFIRVRNLWAEWQVRAARQPVGHEPFGWWLVDDNGIGRMSRKPPQDTIEIYRNTPGYSAAPLFAAPPAQAVDLGQFREPVEDRRGWAQNQYDERGDASMLDVVKECDRLLALINSGKAVQS